ncbi:RNA polymerase sigma factor, partial [Hungatella effluvii]
KLLKEEKAKLIREVLSSLNADDRTIILLRDYEKMAYADIARVTGLSETVVKVRLHRARLKYRSRYEQRGGDSCGM